MRRNELTELNLSPKERRFVSTIVELGDPLAAALKSGYTESDAKVAAWELPRNAQVAAAIALQTRAAIVAGAAVASRYLVAAVKDDAVPHGVRIQAANSLLDRAGIVAPRDAAAPTRELDSCSIEELHALVDQLASKRGDQAKDVTRGLLQHGSEAAPPNDADIFD